MINGFQEHTDELNGEEKQFFLPIIVRGLSGKIGKANAVTNKQITTGFKNRYSKDLKPSRLRKIIHHIRTRGLVKNLVATSNGYYVAQNQRELEVYIESLRQRANSIIYVADALERQKRETYESKQIKIDL